VTGMLADGARVLDVGTGTGRFSLGASAKTSLAVGVDASLKMISRAALKSSITSQRPRVSFLVGEAARLPFRDRSFDAVISVKLLSHYVEIDPYISEMARVLRPSGLLIVDTTHRLGRAYAKIGLRTPIQSYQNYHHTFSDVALAMRKYSVEPSHRSTYSVLPATLTHLMLCRHPRLVPNAVLRRLFDTKVGLLSFVEGIKAG